MRLTTVRVLSLDMGFASLGWSVFELGRAAQHDRPLKLDVFTTKPTNAKRRVFVADDNTSRTAAIFNHLTRLISAYSPSAVAAESFVYHKGIKASAKMGLAWGALISVVTQHALPFLDASPVDVKRATTGQNKASKEEVEDGVRKAFPSVDTALAPCANGMREHAFDSAGVFMAVRASNVINALRYRSA